MGFVTKQPYTPSPLRQLTAKYFSPKCNDSPSRQLLDDLERALGRIQLHERELKKVHAYNRRSYYQDLDERDQARIGADLAAVDAATAKHDAVRREAEKELQKYIHEVEEEERRRKEEEERLRREKEAHERAERERKEREEAERKAKLEREKEAAAKKAAEEKAKAEAEEVKRREREEVAAREKIENEKQAREAAERAQAEKAAADHQAAQDAKIKKQTSDGQTAALSPDVEARHKRYLDIHKKLKSFRKEFVLLAKNNAELKSKVGDMRRAMRTSVGQLTDDKATNKKPTDRIKTALLAALNLTPASPLVPLKDYLLDSVSEPAGAAGTTIPSLLLYLVSVFSKAIVSAFTGECAVNPRAAEPIGTLAAQIFSLAELQFPLSPSDPQNTTPLTAVLLCKIHANAPILFGISGSESTSAGRLRLGWRLEFANDHATTKTFVPEQRQMERMTGLGAGFASLSLRNFSKTKLRNPYPPTNFWESLSHIANTPPDRVQTSHLVILKSMLENSLDRIILFFGNAGVAALREVLIELPRRLSTELRNGTAAKGLALLVEGWQRERNFSLA